MPGTADGQEFGQSLNYTEEDCLEKINLNSPYFERIGTEEGYHLKSQITNTKFQINSKHQFQMIKTILFGILDFGY
jgi:hypothetical protein